MKCPKCGYNSFEYLNQCKKCGNDLVLFKQNSGIYSVLVPVVAQEVAVPTVGIAPELPQDQPVETEGGGEFKWDEPTAEQAEALPDFSFNEQPAEAAPDLGDLLESSVPLDRTAGERNQTPAAGGPSGLAAAPAGFEFSEFLAEEKDQSQAEPAQAQAKPAPELDGDFDFLFNSEEEKK